MKLRNIITGAAAVCAATVFAANPCNVPLAVRVSNPDATLSAADVNALGSRLKQALMAEGFGASDSLAAFALEASVRETGREALGGNRPMVAMLFETDIALVNRLTGETLSQHSLRLNGTGANENAARSAAVNSLNPSNRQLRRFMGHTDSDIANFYLSQLPTLETRALTLSRNGEYQKAMAILTTVPECIPDYSTVQATMETVWQQFRDADCAVKMRLARAAWLSTQNEEGARLAAAYLAAIPERSACEDDAAALLEEIRIWVENERRRLIEKEERERQDEIDRFNAQLQVQMSYIEAMRAIGMEYARSHGLDDTLGAGGDTQEEPQQI